ncbi:MULTISPECIES: phage tail protein [Photorhabdus]|uniref:Phage Tail Collar Domain n=1 Tax=Photorhabdus luminescens TaxID=29488 RepID=A0A1G5QUG3_PHOLU|nr:phage tail protein [Photorhabdus luminescens]SCZ65210.1 Phage Tail Collar Domain [Photorhabdus luminescens]
MARNSAQQSFVDANFARGNVEVVNTKGIYPRINFFSPQGKEYRGFFAIEADLTNDNAQSIYLYKRNAAGNNIYLVNFPNKNGTLATLDDIVPVGVPLPYPHRYTPVGYLTCNGQTFDKSKYPKLAEAYPSGQLFDLRGEFIRGWDDSRGVDPGRMPGTWQGDAIRNITGRLDVRLDGSFSIVDAVSGSFTKTRDTSSGLYCLQEANYARGADNVTFDASRVVPTANENRPRNVALNYIVRAA